MPKRAIAMMVARAMLLFAVTTLQSGDWSDETLCLSRLYPDSRAGCDVRTQGIACGTHLPPRSAGPQCMQLESN
jgi:hypothetical protein